MVSWQGTHTNDWAAWARYHLELAALHAGTPLEAKHIAIAEKYARKATKAARAAR